MVKFLIKYSISSIILLPNTQKKLHISETEWKTAQFDPDIWIYLLYTLYLYSRHSRYRRISIFIFDDVFFCRLLYWEKNQPSQIRFSHHIADIFEQFYALSDLEWYGVRTVYAIRRDNGKGQRRQNGDWMNIEAKHFLLARDTDQGMGLSFYDLAVESGWEPIATWVLEFRFYIGDIYR